MTVLRTENTQCFLSTTTQWNNISAFTRIVRSRRTSDCSRREPTEPRDENGPTRITARYGNRRGIVWARSSFLLWAGYAARSVCLGVEPRRKTHVNRKSERDDQRDVADAASWDARGGIWRRTTRGSRRLTVHTIGGSTSPSEFRENFRFLSTFFKRIFSITIVSPRTTASLPLPRPTASVRTRLSKSATAAAIFAYTRTPPRIEYRRAYEDGQNGRVPPIRARRTYMRTSVGKTHTRIHPSEAKVRWRVLLLSAPRSSVQPTITRAIYYHYYYYKSCAYWFFYVYAYTYIYTRYYYIINAFCPFVNVVG